MKNSLSNREIHTAENDFINRSVSEIMNVLEHSEERHLCIALSGGSSPLPVYAELVRQNINWKNIDIFLVDERIVPLHSDRSNYGNIQKVLLDHIDASSHCMYVASLGQKQSALSYEQLLVEKCSKGNNLPMLDLVVLGMGTDGHTASLFPGTKAINETNKLVVVNEIPKLGENRLTLTYPVLLNARKLLILAPGDEKRKVFQEAKTGGHPISEILKQPYTIIT